MPIKNLGMLRVEPKTSYLCVIPKDWATDKQKDNLFRSLEDWAREQRFAVVRISLISNPLFFGFKADEKVIKVEFQRLSNDTSKWAYSLTKEGVCENSSYPLGSAPSTAPKVLYSWKDFEKGRQPKPVQKTK